MLADRLRLGDCSMTSMKVNLDMSFTPSSWACESMGSQAELFFNDDGNRESSEPELQGSGNICQHRLLSARRNGTVLWGKSTLECLP